MSNPMAQPRSVPKSTRTGQFRPAEESIVSAKTIRYHESINHESIGLVRPAFRWAANYRRFDRAAIQTLPFSAEVDYKRSRRNG
jgi:hypothetical protein